MPSNSKNYDKKIYRLVAILNQLNSREKVHSKALAEEFNVSIRSIQRDLELLNMTGFPLASAQKGAYSFTDGFSLGKATLTGEEASLLAFLYEIAKSLGKKFEDSFSDILGKVLYKEGESAFYAKIPEGIKLDEKTPHLKDLELAIQNASVVSIYYQKQDKEIRLKVDPLKIAFYDGFWYLVCRGHGRSWILKLRLEKIRKVEVLNKHYSVPKNLKKMLDQSVSAWFTEKRDKKVTLKVDKEVARFFKQKAYFPLQKIVKEEKDGTLTIETLVCQYMEAIPVALRWLPYVRVLKPKEVSDEVNYRIKQYVQNSRTT